MNGLEIYLFFYFFAFKKIFSEKLQISSVNPKIDATNPDYKPGGGDKVYFMYTHKDYIKITPKKFKILLFFGSDFNVLLFKTFLQFVS
jgi:hypothetical protein